MRDKYNLGINSDPNLLVNTMNAVYQGYPQFRSNLDQLNKITLSELKERVLSATAASGASASAAASMSPGASPFSPVPDKEEAPVVPPEVEFVQKLQQLEQQRTAFVPPPPSQAEKFDVRPAEAVYNHPQSTATPIIPTNIQTVYMPTPPRIGTEIKIASWQRDWLNSPARNGFTYSKGLPPRLNITDVRLGCVILPGAIAMAHPLLSVYIEGPNNKELQISVLLNHIVGNFGVYKPATPSLSFIYLLALPWKITIEAADGEVIDLGADKVPFKVTQTHFFVATMEVPMDNFACVGDSLRVYADKKILPAEVIAVREREIDVKGSGAATEGYLLNYSKQVTLLLDAVKNWQPHNHGPSQPWKCLSLFLSACRKSSCSYKWISWKEWPISITWIKKIYTKNFSNLLKLRIVRKCIFVRSNKADPSLFQKSGVWLEYGIEGKADSVAEDGVMERSSVCNTFTPRNTVALPILLPLMSMGRAFECSINNLQ